MYNVGSATCTLCFWRIISPCFIQIIGSPLISDCFIVWSTKNTHNMPSTFPMLDYTSTATKRSGRNFAEAGRIRMTAPAPNPPYCWRWHLSGAWKQRYGGIRLGMTRREFVRLIHDPQRVDTIFKSDILRGSTSATEERDIIHRSAESNGDVLMYEY